MAFPLIVEGNLFYRSLCAPPPQQTATLEEMVRGLFRRVLLYVFRAEKLFAGAAGPQSVTLCLRSFEYRRSPPTDGPAPHVRGRLNLPKIVKTLLVLRLLLEGGGRPVKKRELFYRLVTRFRDQQELDRMLAELCFLAQVPRRFLSVFPAAKGLVFGAVWVGEAPRWDFLGDVQRYPAGRAVDFHHDAGLRATGRWVLVIEKEAVFFDLLASGFARVCPDGVLVTARGYSDFTTRGFLRSLFLQNPALPFFYLGDFDPFGLDILLNYLLGSRWAIAEQTQLPFMCPLGLGAADCARFSMEAGQELSAEDRARLTALLTTEVFDALDLVPAGGVWQALMREKLTCLYADLQWMKNVGRKFEIEALGSNGAVLEFVCRKLNTLIV